jgi:ABC-type nitrate/sulfonate/bicarbonate transport system substrate-binding protein
MPPPDFDGGIEVNADGLLARTWRRLRFREPPPFDILVDGGTPYMVLHTLSAREPRRIALAGTDCVVRAHIVARQGISSLEELKGKRLGISGALRTTTGFAALLLAKRMGWDPVDDISIMLNGRDVAALRAGLVDAIVAAERAFAAVRQEDFSVLEDTRTWNEAVAGNSVLVQPEWLEDPMHREAARRFLMATVEAISLFHQDRELALAVLEEWNGVPDQDFAETMYERGAWTPRAPFPCYEGITRTMEMYDSNEMRRYAPEDFYDDSLMREIVESGFVDGLYR